MILGRTRECHPCYSNDIRYASSIPRSFMVHTMPACVAKNSASGVSSFPGGRKVNERLHLSEWLSAIDREGERGVGLPVANSKANRSALPKRRLGLSVDWGPVDGVTDGECENNEIVSRWATGKHSIGGNIHKRDGRTLVTGTPIR